MRLLPAPRVMIVVDADVSVYDRRLEENEPLLVKEFSYTGASADPKVGLLDESVNNYKYFCSGRRFCSRFTADLQVGFLFYPLSDGVAVALTCPFLVRSWSLATICSRACSRSSRRRSKITWCV